MNGHFYKKVSRKFPDSFFRPLPEQTKNPATFGGYGVCLGATDPIRTDDLLITSELLCQLSHSSKYSYSLLPEHYTISSLFCKALFQVFLISGVCDKMM